MSTTADVIQTTKSIIFKLAAALFTFLKNFFKKKKGKTAKKLPRDTHIDALLIEPPRTSYVLSHEGDIVGVYSTKREAGEVARMHGGVVLQIVNPIVLDGKVYRKTQNLLPAVQSSGSK